jgi:two-component system cell cycle sensor histidine kinase/response regulator CckA
MSASVYPQAASAVVLCIADSQDTLDCERAFLESFGYTVLTALRGSRGLELASLYSVDVIVLDYFMPAVNGEEVAVELRRLRPEAPIILVTEGVGVPDQTLSVVDALIAKDSLASQLLLTIAHLHGCGQISLPAYDT